MAERSGRTVALLLAAAALLSACDGYPTKDEPLPNPFHMSAPERVALLNQLGEAADAGQRWRYRLQDCRLSLERGARWWRAGEASRHELRGAALEIRSLEGEEGRGYELLLLPPGGAPAPAFSSRRLLDTQRARQLVQLLVRDCARGAQAGTQRSTT